MNLDLDTPEKFQIPFNRMKRIIPNTVRQDPVVQKTTLAYLKLGGERLARHYIRLVKYRLIELDELKKMAREEEMAREREERAEEMDAEDGDAEASVEVEEEQPDDPIQDQLDEDESAGETVASADDATQENVEPVDEPSGTNAEQKVDPLFEAYAKDDQTPDDVAESIAPEAKTPDMREDEEQSVDMESSEPDKHTGIAVEPDVEELQTSPPSQDASPDEPLETTATDESLEATDAEQEDESADVQTQALQQDEEIEIADDADSVVSAHESPITDQEPASDEIINWEFFIPDKFQIKSKPSDNETSD